MTHKFQKYDPVFRRENLGNGDITWKTAGTISGTLNKATHDGKPLYSVKGYDGILRPFPEDQLKHASDIQQDDTINFKPRTMA